MAEYRLGQLKTFKDVERCVHDQRNFKVYALNGQLLFLKVISHVSAILASVQCQ